MIDELGAVRLFFLEGKQENIQKLIPQGTIYLSSSISCGKAVESKELLMAVQ